MGYPLYREVKKWAPATLTHREKLVAMVLADDANDVSRETFSSVVDPDILRYAMVKNDRDMRKVLTRLVEEKVLERTTIGGNGRAAKYRFLHLAPAVTPTVAGPNRTANSNSTPNVAGLEKTANSGVAGTDRTANHASAVGPDVPEKTSYSRVAGPNPNSCRSKLDLPTPSTSSTTSSASKQEEPAAERLGYGIPDAARPLVDGLTAAGVIVRWPFTGNAWFPLLALIEKSGVPALVDHAVKTAARTDVDSAKYFMSGWRELPPLPGPGTPSSRPRTRPSNRHANPDDHDVYDEDLI